MIDLVPLQWNYCGVQFVKFAFFHPESRCYWACLWSVLFFMRSYLNLEQICEGFHNYNRKLLFSKMSVWIFDGVSWTGAYVESRLVWRESRGGARGYWSAAAGRERDAGVAACRLNKAPHVCTVASPYVQSRSRHPPGSVASTSRALRRHTWPEYCNYSSTPSCSCKAERKFPVPCFLQAHFLQKFQYKQSIFTHWFYWMRHMVLRCRCRRL